MKSLEEINSQIEKRADVLKKLRAEKDKIIEKLSANYGGKYFKMIINEDAFWIIKVSEVCLDELDSPYKYYGSSFKFCEGDYRFEEDHVLFDDDCIQIEPVSKEEYEEYKNRFIEKLKEV